jgi:hypothetical protein
MKRKAKRFGEGGDTDDAQARANRGESEKTKMVSQQETGNLGGTGLKRETFGEAFARARRNKEKTFEFQGKKYGTALKSEAKAKPAKAADDEYMTAGPEYKRQGEFPAAAAANKLTRLTGVATEEGRAAKARSYEEARQTAAEQKRRMAAQTRAAGTTDMDTLRKSDMDAYLPVDEQRIYSQFKKGGAVKKMASGGKTSSASSRADGCAMRGKTRGKMY